MVARHDVLKLQRHSGDRERSGVAHDRPERPLPRRHHLPEPEPMYRSGVDAEFLEYEDRIAGHITFGAVLRGSFASALCSNFQPRFHGLSRHEDRLKTCSFLKHLSSSMKLPPRLRERVLGSGCLSCYLPLATSYLSFLHYSPLQE